MTPPRNVDPSSGSLRSIPADEAGEDEKTFRKWMEMALGASDAGIWEWDIESGEVFWDERTERLFGYEPGYSPIGYEEFVEHLPADDRESLEENIQRAIEHDESYQATFRIRSTEGGFHWVEARGAVVYEDGEPRRMIGVQADITEEKRVDRALEVVRECRNVILRAEAETELFRGVCRELVGASGYELAWIGEARETAGKPVEPVAVHEPDHPYLEDVEIHWGEGAEGQGPTGRSIRTGEPVAAQNIPDDPNFEPWRDALGEYGFESSVALPIQVDEGIYGSINLYASDPHAFAEEELEWLDQLADDVGHGIRGIRTQRELEETTISLEEKEVLLEEIHHRVKNNMQVISSIIRLHTANDFNKSTREIMEDCQNRIQSMAMVHDMLYRSEDLAEISFDRYVNELVETVIRFNKIPGDSVDVSLEIDPSLNLSLSQAIPCGLIINELVSNSCEHAFEEDRRNRLVVEFTEDGEELVLRVRDNGPGFPEGVGTDSSDSIGFEILRALGEYELNGELEFRSEPMTTVELTFRLDDIRD